MGDVEINGIDSTVIKGGETCMEANFKRSTSGLTIGIKVHPSIEEFIKNLGNGESTEVKVYGRHWASLTDKQLMVYHLGSDLSNLVTDNGVPYIINRPGTAIIQPTIEGSRVAETLNLSFIRLVGIGEKDGVTFTVKNGVFTANSVQEMAKNTGDAFRRFFIDYMKPINSDIKIVRQQW